MVMLFKIFFKDAYKWYEAKTLQAYGSEEVKPRSKRKKFSTLKNKAPKVPDHTCPIIDNVLDTFKNIISKYIFNGTHLLY